MSCVRAHDPQLARLADAIAQRVGPHRFHVWFNNSTRLSLRQEVLEIAVPNDFISEWISKNFNRPIQEAAHEVLGGPLPVRFSVTPELFDGSANGDAGHGKANGHGRINGAAHAANGNGHVGNGAGRNGHAGNGKAGHDHAGNGRAHVNGNGNGHAANGKPPAADPDTLAAGKMPDALRAVPTPVMPRTMVSTPPIARGVSPASAFAVSAREPGGNGAGAFVNRSRLRHEIESFVVGPANQLAYNTAMYVSEFPGSQYNPLFIHGACGLGKTHLLQGLCRRFIQLHPTKRWMYLTGEEFTNEFLAALRTNKMDTFRRKVRDLDLLVIDDVHFIGGKKATQEEFLHTFNAIEAMGRQVVMASDNHPKLIEEFGESLINRFVSGMVVRIDPPNFQTRCDLLRNLGRRVGLELSEEVASWIARRVTQNVRELEGAINRINAHVKLTGLPADVTTAQSALGDLDRQLVAPVRPENVMQAVCNYFGLENKDLMSGRRQRTISLARSVAMFLVRKTAKLSFPEIGARMGKRNHSTVISACRRIERATTRNEKLAWTSSVGEREEEAIELLQRLEEHSRAMS